MARMAPAAEDQERQNVCTTTISGHITRAKRFFSAAVQAHYIAYSPFADIVAGSQVNDARNAYISADDVELVIDKAPY